MKHVLQVRSPWLILVLLGVIGALVLGQSWLSGAALAGPASVAAIPAGASAAAQDPHVQISHGPLVSPAVYNGDVRQLPQLNPHPIPDREMPPPREPSEKTPKRPLPGAEEPPPAPNIPPSLNMPAPNVSFAGLDHNTWGAGWPPDTVGDVGPNHYIQAVNTSIGIFSKTGTQLAAFTFNSLWAGAGTGTACDSSHQGDPTVVYDPLADRWFVADFAFTGNGTVPPFYECVAVSKTSNPVTGGWWLYPIRGDDAAHPWFPDYPKMGIWPDGLYMTANMFDSTNTFREVRGWAFNRGDLESGAALRSVIVDLGTTTYFSMLPSNLRGTPPPAGRENFFISESQTLFAYHVFKFHVDYSGSGSTFTGPTNVSQTSYTVAAATVPSPANPLDSLRERLMMQAQYRNIGGTESLWVNHTVRTSATGPTGIQWAQINVTGGTIVSPPVQQQIFGNLGNDGVHRWMGSLAVDRSGDMALGYSASSSTLNPAIRYAGRLVSDPLNTLAQGEATLIAGTGSQSGNCGGSTCIRWGDYSAMTVDPVDDCTFWYTQEYYIATGLNWQTRIGSFTFPSCAPLATATTTSTATGTATSTPNPTATTTATSTANPTATTTATTTANPTATQTATAAATSTATTTATPIACGTSTVINGALDATDPTAPDRLTRSGTPSNCATPNACPGLSFAGTVHYDSYTFANTTGSPQCVTVRVDAPLCDVVSATYLTVFDPAILCANYLGDSGGSTQGGGALNYSITVPAGGQFEVLVEETNPNTFCGTYTLTVGGCGLATPTVTPTTTATATETQTAVATATETQTAVATATETQTAVATATETAVATETGTAVATETETAVATATETVLATVTETATAGPTGTATWTVTVTGTPTDTPIASITPTAGPTNTGVPANTATRTVTPVPPLTAPPTATATPVNCPLPFTDVDQFNPFYQFIQCLYCRGIISGYADNTFRWGNDVTRGQVTKFVANAAGLNDTVSGQTFTDVPPSNPFYVFIERLYRHGDINGYDTAANCPTGIPCFRWELPVTRGQLAKIDSNAAGYNETPPPGTQHFNDTPPANPFYLWIERLSLHGVINGYDCGGPGEPCPGVYFRPFANITRGQTSKVVSQSFFPNACAPAQR